MPPSTTDPLAVAFEHHRTGNTVAAEQLYRQIVAANPNHAAAWHCLGVLCLQTGRASEAADSIARAVALAPDNPEFYNHLGAAYGTLERHDEAVAALRRSVQLRPGAGDTHYNLGTALRNAGQLENAVVSFQHAIAANPDSAETHYNLANTLRELKRQAEAEASYREALRVRPGYLKALVNLGSMLRDLRRFDEALTILRSAVELSSSSGSAVQNLGTTLRDSGRFAEAAQWLTRAVELEPESAEAQNNLGTALQGLADYAGARTCYERALALNSDLPDAHFSRATLRLRDGDLAGGFAEYEWRWKCSGFSDRGFAQPRWDGLPLEGRTILLYAEQGLGDTIHFVRFAREARARGGRVLVECQAPLAKLLAGSRDIDQLMAIGEPHPAFDVHAPLMSLPAILGVSLDSVTRDEASRGPYLHADPALVERWRGVLAAYDGLRIGICWQGNPQFLFDPQRSFPLAALEPVARQRGIRLVSLQKGQGTEQIATAGFDLIELEPALDNESGPFMDTAAVITQLDLVITTDTAIAHLAGALGAPVWTVLSANPDWRWIADRQDTPWYPSMRLFRQQRLGEWRDVMDRVAGEVAALAADRPLKR